MQIVSKGDNLHEMSNPVFWENKKKNITILSPAELAQSGKGKRCCYMQYMHTVPNMTNKQNT